MSTKVSRPVLRGPGPSNGAWLLGELRVRNSVGTSRPSGTGVGLRNTEARLHYLYSKEASFSFVFEDEGNAAATLTLPALGEHRQTRIEGRLDPIEIEVQGHAGIDR